MRGLPNFAFAFLVTGALTDLLSSEQHALQVFSGLGLILVMGITAVVALLTITGQQPPSAGGYPMGLLLAMLVFMPVGMVGGVFVAVAMIVYAAILLRLPQAGQPG